MQQISLIFTSSFRCYVPPSLCLLVKLVNCITLKEVTTSKAVKTAISAKNCPKLTTTSNMAIDLQILNM
ncbi:hypothetical protein Scep_019322 [Stephania cephalantha]|uniref:Uncharacterized protein n=1 Tax=Stephania cephalantha TaxID=152367 RepID=A0AAP0NM18_9MAGN